MTPVYLDSINRAFKIQFDLGSNKSMIYEYSLDTIMSKYPYLKDKVIFGNDYKSLNIKTKVDNYTLSFDSIPILEDYGEKANYDDLSNIGPIGADVIDEKILIIDFENTNLEILDDSTYLDKSKFSFVPLEYKYGKIFIPLSINGKTHNFYMTQEPL